VAVVRRAQRDRAAVEQNIKTRNLLHPVSNQTASAEYTNYMNRHASLVA